MEADSRQQTQHDLRELRTRLDEVRRTVLLLITVPGMALIALGVCLPAFSGTVGGEDAATDYRILTAGFQMLGERGGDGASPLPVAVGFLGLLLALMIFAGIVGFEILGSQGAVVPDWLRRTSGLLAVAGACVAVLFSWIGAASDAQDASGGWGALITLAGLVLTLTVIRSPRWHDLWLDPRPTPRRPPG